MSRINVDRNAVQFLSVYVDGSGGCGENLAPGVVIVEVPFAAQYVESGSGAGPLEMLGMTQGHEGVVIAMPDVNGRLAAGQVQGPVVAPQRPVTDTSAGTLRRRLDEGGHHPLSGVR